MAVKKSTDEIYNILSFQKQMIISAVLLVIIFYCILAKNGLK